MVERGGDIVAVLVLKVAEEGFLLDNVAVDPVHQGTGLGRWLLAHAESEARRQGFDSVYLYTQEAMTENLALTRGSATSSTRGASRSACPACTCARTSSRTQSAGRPAGPLAGSRRAKASEPARQMLEDASGASGSANRTVER